MYLHIFLVKTRDRECDCSSALSKHDLENIVFTSYILRHINMKLNQAAWGLILNDIITTMAMPSKG